MSTETITPPVVAGTDFVGRYYELKDYIDAVNAENAPLEDELAAVVAEGEKLRVKAEGISAKIDDNRGREKWLAVKRDLRIIAAGLGKIPPRPAKE